MLTRDINAKNVFFFFLPKLMEMQVMQTHMPHFPSAPSLHWLWHVIDMNVVGMESLQLLQATT